MAEIHHKIGSPGPNRPVRFNWAIIPAVLIGVIVVFSWTLGAVQQFQPISSSSEKREPSRADKTVAKPESTTQPAQTEVQSESEARAEKLRSLGLNPDVAYPFFPLVYGPYSGERGEYTTTITGTVKNYGEETVRSAMIEFSIYDGDRNKVGSAWAAVTDLGPGETWKYKATYFGDDGRTYGLSDIKFR